MYDSLRYGAALKSEPPAAEQPEESAESAHLANTNVYYTGLDPLSTKEQVFQVFSRFGRVVDCKVLIGAHCRR